MYKIIGGDQKEYGPISTEQLRAWIAEGRVNSQTPLQAEGQTGWRPLGEFPEFAAHTAAHVPPSQPAKSVKVFGILSIIFGTLGVLCIPLSIFGMTMAAKQPGYQPPTSKEWMTISLIVQAVGSVVSLAAGVGLVKYREWARKLAVYYAVFSVVFGIVGIFMTKPGGMGGASEEMTRTIGLVGLIVGLAVNWTYNGLLIFYLTRPAAKMSTS